MNDQLDGEIRALFGRLEDMTPPAPATEKLAIHNNSRTRLGLPTLLAAFVAAVVVAATLVLTLRQPPDRVGMVAVPESVTRATETGADTTVPPGDSTVATSPTSVVASSAPHLDTVYRAVARVIEARPESPMAAFTQHDSEPPEVIHGVALSPWDWNLVANERDDGTTTWTESYYELLGTWDGLVFTLIEAPKLAESNAAQEPGTLTPECDPSEWLQMFENLDLEALGILTYSDDTWDGRCGVAIEALVDTPELRDALVPFGEAASVTFALDEVG